jgi:hypothetical protein
MDVFLSHHRPIRPRTTMMVRRVSAGLIAVLLQIAIPSREVLGYVGGWHRCGGGGIYPRIGEERDLFFSSAGYWV